MNMVDLATAVVAACVVGCATALARAWCLQLTNKIVSSWVWMVTLVASPEEREDQRQERKSWLWEYSHHPPQARSSDSDLAVQILCLTVKKAPEDLLWAAGIAARRVASWLPRLVQSRTVPGRRRQLAINEVVNNILANPDLGAGERRVMPDGLVADTSDPEFGVVYSVERDRLRSPVLVHLRPRPRGS